MTEHQRWNAIIWLMAITGAVAGVGVMIGTWGQG